MIESLAKGDEVSTASGLMGKITEIKDQYVTVELAPNLTVKMQRSAIGAVLPKDTLKSI